MRFIETQNLVSSALARLALVILLIIGPASVFSFSQTRYFPPHNDDFADAQVISDESGAVQGELLGATVEPNEPMYQKGTATVWFTWTAPADRSMTFRVSTGGEPMVGIAIFTGEDLGKMLFLGKGDSQDRITLIVHQGMEYKIQASTKSSEDFDLFYLSWNVNGAESWKQFDFDGPDNSLGEPEYGHSDLAIMRGANDPYSGPAEWWIWSQRAGSAMVYSFGNLATPMYYSAADYDGDERVDIAIFYPDTGFYWIFQSSTQTFRVEQWGAMADIPVEGDFDGDDVADLAIWRAQSTTFWIKRSTDGSPLMVTWGIPGDMPVPADYDGDGLTDIALARNEENGHKRFYIQRSSDHEVFTTEFGLRLDSVVPGDFDGDGKADIGVFRMDNSTFHYLRSYDGSYVALPFPESAIPFAWVTAGDYFGGAASDVCVWRFDVKGVVFCLPDGGRGSLETFEFGLHGDMPLAKKNGYHYW